MTRPRSIDDVIEATAREKRRRCVRGATGPEQAPREWTAAEAAERDGDLVAEIIRAFPGTLELNERHAA